LRWGGVLAGGAIAIAVDQIAFQPLRHRGTGLSAR
jgi:hypothetical protein